MFEVYNHKNYNIQPSTSAVDKHLWRLDLDSKIYFKLDGVLYELHVKKGIIYDKASIPRLPQLILGKGRTGRHDLGTLLHDVLYMLKKNQHDKIILGLERDTCVCELRALVGTNWVKSLLELDRKQSDYLMFQVIANTKNVDVQNDRKFRNTLRMMYFGIRIGGAKYWKRSTPLNQINPLKCSDDA